MSNKDTENKSMQRLPLIPIELHTEFKLACIKDGKTMRACAIEAIQDYIDKIKKQSDK